MQPSMPRAKDPTPSPQEEFISSDTFHSFPSVVYFHSLEVVLEGKHTKSVIRVIVALLLEKKQVRGRAHFFLLQGWLMYSKMNFQLKRNVSSRCFCWVCHPNLGGWYPLQELVPGVLLSVVIDSWHKAKDSLAEGRFWVWFSFIPLSTCCKIFRKYLNLPG